MLFRHALNDRTSSGSMMSGNRGARTHDLLVNSQALCQLSYVPENWYMLLSMCLLFIAIREECLFSLYADATAKSKMCDSNASSCSRSMCAAITPHSRKSGGRESVSAPLRSALNEAPLELQRPAVSLTPPAYKAGALTDELPPGNRKGPLIRFPFQAVLKILCCS